MVAQDELNAKIKLHYSGCIVNKKLSQRQEIVRLPRFVSEFLLTKLSDYENDKEKFAQELNKVVELINSY